MKKILALICVTALAAGHAAGQSAGQGKAAGQPVGATSQGEASGELAEAARLNSQVVKLFGEGKYDEALPLARRVLEIREKALGGEHLLVGYALNNLASIYVEKGKGGEAESLYKRALTIVEKDDAARDLAGDINTHLGRLGLKRGDYKGAEPYLQRALEIVEKAHGADAAALVPVLFDLTDINILRGEFDQAHAFLARALSILRRQPPRKDPATAKRLKGYLCPLMGLSAANDKELAGKVSNAVWRLEKPETAAEYEKDQKERAARGEADKEIVEGRVLNGRAIEEPQPDYPIEAKQQRVMGTVVVQIMVDETGRVIQAEALCGHPLLAKASVEAARHARFTPTLLSGSPVKVSGIITYNFVLQ